MHNDPITVTPACYKRRRMRKGQNNKIYRFESIASQCLHIKGDLQRRTHVSPSNCIEIKKKCISKLIE